MIARQIAALSGRTLNIHHGGVSHPVRPIPFVIGRAKNADLVLHSSSVSRRHARLRFEGTWLIEDLESRNGTVVNGVRAPRRAEIKAGDIVTLGDELLVVLFGEDREAPESESRRLSPVSGAKPKLPEPFDGFATAAGNV